MHNNFSKRENYPRGQRAEIPPVDEAANISKAEIQTAVDSVSEEPKPAHVFGFVVSCPKLNVRKEPNANAEVVTLIPAFTTVIIDISASSEDFYKISTPSGIKGFCAKKYIQLKR